MTASSLVIHGYSCRCIVLNFHLRIYMFYIPSNFLKNTWCDVLLHFVLFLSQRRCICQSSSSRPEAAKSVFFPNLGTHWMKTILHSYAHPHAHRFWSVCIDYYSKNWHSAEMVTEIERCKNVHMQCCSGCFVAISVAEKLHMLIELHHIDNNQYVI